MMYKVKVIGQVVKSFTIEGAEDETDARNLAESEFLDNYGVVAPNGSGMAWDIIESVESEEIL
jgi:hypothetical protein